MTLRSHLRGSAHPRRFAEEFLSLETSLLMPTGRDVPKDIPALASHLRLARHLKEPDFVPLYIRYRVARILRCLAARTISDFLAGLHSLLALPKGDAD